MVSLDKHGMFPLWEQGGWRVRGEICGLVIHEHLCRRYFCPDNQKALLFVGASLKILYT